MNNLFLKNFDDFKIAARNINIELDEKQINDFKKYYDFLYDWNKKINLISRKSFEVKENENNTVLEKHFLDSILFLQEISEVLKSTPQPSILDIGSGGGFPAIPIAIIKNNWDFNLCESIGKKANFLKELVKELDLKNISVINERVENLHKSSLKKSFNLITSRAVTNIEELIKYSFPLLKNDGILCAFKSNSLNEELKAAEKIIKKENLLTKIYSKDLNGAERNLLFLSRSKV